ncbi:MAG: hypothetical protein R2830_09490 [Saprospiraceae bacterium]
MEIKYSTTPKPSKGFHIAAADLGTKQYFILCPVVQSFPLSEEIRL